MNTVAVFDINKCMFRNTIGLAKEACSELTLSFHYRITQSNLRAVDYLIFQPDGWHIDFDR